MRSLNPDERNRFKEEALVLIKELHRKAREEIENGEQIPALMYVLSEDGETRFVSLQKAMDASKDIAEELMKKIQATPGVLATIFMCEAWILELDKDEVKGEFPRPSTHPNKREAVVWVVETVVGDLFTRAYISRNPSRLGDLVVPDLEFGDSTAEGRFVGGFKQQKQKAGRSMSLKSFFDSQTEKGKQ